MCVRVCVCVCVCVQVVTGFLPLRIYVHSAGLARFCTQKVRARLIITIIIIIIIIIIIM